MYPSACGVAVIYGTIFFIKNKETLCFPYSSSSQAFSTSFAQGRAVRYKYAQQRRKYVTERLLIFNITTEAILLQLLIATAYVS